MLGQKKYAEAEPLLIAGCEGMLKRKAKIPPPAKPRLTEALERLVELYEATSKPDEAAKWHGAGDSAANCQASRPGCGQSAGGRESAGTAEAPPVDAKAAKPDPAAPKLDEGKSKLPQSK